MGRLANKVAIARGAGQGLGQSTAQRFAEEGAKVVVADLIRRLLRRRSEWLPIQVEKPSKLSAM